MTETTAQDGDFSVEGYAALLTALLAEGYDGRDFARAEPASRHLILRHDLDMSIAAALPIAEAERNLGLTATYFVLMRTEMYNPFSRAARQGLDRLAALGHEIGLHFDAAAYDGAAADDEVAAECALLEDLTGRPVETVSFHRPAPALLGREGRVGGRRHAYEPRFFREMGYCSDSRGGWHHGHPLDHPAVKEGRALQLLTHPIWWSGRPASPTERLDRFLAERLDILDRSLAENCETHLPGRLALTPRETKR